jgi:hypothetical protein
VEPALSGFVNGSMDVDWVQVMSAARAIYRRPDQSQKEVQRTAPQVVTPVEPQQESQTAEPEPVGGLPEVETPVGEEGYEEEQTETQEPEPAGTEEQTEVQEPTSDETEQQTEVQEMPEEQSPETEETEQPACLFMTLDISIPWPEAVEPLRMLFQQLPACTPFAADGYTFICAPLPGNGNAYSLVGVRVEDERPTSVCYGIPGFFAPEPPVGLDGYMWRGSGVSGWWVTFIDALTGEEVPE